MGNFEKKYQAIAASAALCVLASGAPTPALAKCYLASGPGTVASPGANATVMCDADSPNPETTNISASGDGVSVSLDQTAGLSTVGTAVNVRGGSTVVNNGSISIISNSGPFAYGMAADGNGTSITNNGTIKTDNGGTGISISGNGNTGINTGTVEAGWISDFGLMVVGDGNTFRNSGYITTPGRAVYFVPRTGQSGTFVNETGGSVVVTSAAEAILSGGEGTLTVQNNGLIQGDVSLGSDHDTLIIGDGGSVVGNIMTNGLVVMDRTDTFTYSGIYSGNGGLQKSGAGTAILAGTNTYTGGTTVDAGTLQVGNGGTTGSITGNVTNNGILTFNRSDAFTYADMISGTGALVKNGTGTLILTGANTYTGGTIINNGTLQIGSFGMSGSIAGNVTNNSILAFNNSDPITYAGVISGTGTLLKDGAGTLVLTGANTYTGLTMVNTGMLQLGSAGNPNARLGGNAWVGINGAIGGSGTIQGSVINSGTHSSGNSIGTMHVTGYYQLYGGSNVLQEVAADGSGDKLIVDGKVSIVGGKVTVIPTDPLSSYARVTNYQFITSGAGISGTFSDISSTVAGFTPYLSYGTNSVNLALVRDDISLGTVANTANQASLATALSAQTTSPLYALVVSNSDPNARAALDSVSGELHASLAGQLLNDGDFLAEAVRTRGTAGKGIGTWAHGTYRRASLDGSGSAAPARNQLSGISGGIETDSEEWLTLGLATGYSTSKFKVPNRNSRGNIDTTYLGAYSEATLEKLHIGATVSYAWNSISTLRNMNFATLNQSVAADYSGQTVNAAAEARYRFALGTFEAEPFVRANLTNLHTDAIAESGGIAAVDGGATNRSLFSTALGAKLETTYRIGKGVLRPFVSGGWQHRSGDLTPQQTLELAGGPSFVVLGAPQSQSALFAEAGFGFNFGRLELGLRYGGRFGGHSTQDTVSANVRLTF